MYAFTGPSPNTLRPEGRLCDQNMNLICRTMFIMDVPSQHTDIVCI